MVIKKVKKDLTHTGSQMQHSSRLKTFNLGILKLVLKHCWTEWVKFFKDTYQYETVY